MENVSFYSEGKLIQAHLYLPKDTSDLQHPAIVMCHGFAGVKELLLPGFAKKFQQAGFAVLTFDYRGFGKSEGEKGILQPGLQIRDIFNAITFVSGHPQINPEQIALWGTSYGGANAIIAASQDKRIKCICAQLTFANGKRVITGEMEEAEKNKFLMTLNKMEQKKVKSNKEMMVPIVKVLTDEQSKKFYQDYSPEFPELDIRIPFLTVKETMNHKAENYMDQLNIPIHITAAEKDSVNPLEESEILYQKANEPKQLDIIAGATHYEVYEGKLLEQVSQFQIEWFQKHLLAELVI